MLPAFSFGGICAYTITFSTIVITIFTHIFLSIVIPMLTHIFLTIIRYSEMASRRK